MWQVLLHGAREGLGRVQQKETLPPRDLDENWPVSGTAGWLSAEQGNSKRETIQ